MSPRTVTGELLRETPVLRTGDTVSDAVRRLIDSDLPALPVVDDRERLAGVFGEREFMAAVFPGYLKELKYAGFVRRSLEDALEKRSECGRSRSGAHEHASTSTSAASSPTCRWRRSSSTTAC